MFFFVYSKKLSAYSRSTPQGKKKKRENKMKIAINKKTITIRSNDEWDAWVVDDVASSFRPGAVGTLAARYNHSVDAIRNGTDDRPVYVWLGSERGIPGNSNPSVLCTDGWRGTTDDRAVYALGVVQIVSVSRLARGYGYRITYKHK